MVTTFLQRFKKLSKKHIPDYLKYKKQTICCAILGIVIFFTILLMGAVLYHVYGFLLALIPAFIVGIATYIIAYRIIIPKNIQDIVDKLFDNAQISEISTRPTDFSQYWRNERIN